MSRPEMFSSREHVADQLEHHSEAIRPDEIRRGFQRLNLLKEDLRKREAELVRLMADDSVFHGLSKSFLGDIAKMAVRSIAERACLDLASELGDEISYALDISLDSLRRRATQNERNEHEWLEAYDVRDRAGFDADADEETIEKIVQIRRCWLDRAEKLSPLS